MSVNTSGFLSRVVTIALLMSLFRGFAPARIGSADTLGSGSWTALHNLPVATQETGVATVGGLVYIVGGDALGGPTSSVWAYNPATDTWSAPGQIAALPGPPRNHIGVTAVNGKIYAIGGLTTWPAPSVPDVYAYDPTSNSWTRMADLPDPRPRSGIANHGRGAMGVAVINGEIYVAGGLNGTTAADAVALNSFTMFDPGTNTWTALPPMPTQRDHLVGAAVNGKFYAIGGRNVQITPATGANEVYDPSTNSWSSLAPLPYPRGGLGAGVLNGKIVVFGGEGNGPSNGTWPNTEEFDPNTGSWRELASMITPRHGTNGAVIGGNIYVPGGGAVQGGGHQSSANEVFTYGPGGEPTATPGNGPTLTVSPNAVSPHSTVLLNGSGFVPGESVTLTWNGAGTTKLTVSPGGTFSLQSYVFSSPGAVVIVAQGSSGDQASSTLTVLGPTPVPPTSTPSPTSTALPTATPSPGMPAPSATPTAGSGSGPTLMLSPSAVSPHSTVLLNGSGFVPGESVILTWNGAGTTKLTVSPGGTFSLQSYVFSSPGAVVIVAQGSSGDQASATLTVLGSGPVPPTPTASATPTWTSTASPGPSATGSPTLTSTPSPIASSTASPTSTAAPAPTATPTTGSGSGPALTVSPNAVPPHSAVSLNGSGFVPGESVTLTWNGAAATKLTASPGGTFSLQSYVFSSPGTVTIVARGSSGDQASTTLSVLGPTPVPPTPTASATPTWTSTATPSPGVTYAPTPTLMPGEATSATRFLGFYGSPCPGYPSYATCWNGGIANSGFTGILPGTNPANSGKLTLNTAGSGTLSLQSTSGDLLHVSSGTPVQDNALVMPFDGSAAPFSIGARLIGPFALNGGNQSGGIVLGLNSTHYARLAIAYNNGDGQPGIQFALQDPTQINGFNIDPNISNPALNVSTVITLDLFLSADPVHHQLSALYRVNSNDPGDVKLITTVPWSSSFFVNPIYGGLVTTSDGSPTSLTFTYDWFKLGPPVGAGANNVSFSGPTQIIAGAVDGNANFSNPTTMAFGPDGRLYVGTQSGRLFAFTLDSGDNVTGVQEYDDVYNKPNHTCPIAQPDPPPLTCPLDPSVRGRQLLGLTFDPASTATNMILYVTHSDPRILPKAADAAKVIDTHSGTLTRLTISGPQATVSQDVDLITGLPRSRENHSINGLHFGPDGWLYFAQGGNTNEGAPSSYFDYLPEYFLSSTILRANVNAPGGFTPIDVRAVTSTASLAPYAGMFEVYATGLRNAYDVVWHSNGRLYVNDNAGNAGLGNTPGPSDGCPSGQSSDLAPSPPDELEVMQQGMYYGHPAPVRGECAWENGSYPMASPPYNLPPDPNYVPPIYEYPTGEVSVDGVVEYTGNAFNGALKGNLIVATYAGTHTVRRLVLSADGLNVVRDSVLASGLSTPLAVTTGPDGSIFIANITGPSAIYVMKPNTVLSAAACPAPGTDPAVTDSDGNGFTDLDKLDNGTDLCNPAATPPHFGTNLISDLNNPDIAGDGIPNNQNQLQFDPSDGMKPLPRTLDFYNSTGGIQNTGFTGVQIPSGASLTEAGNGGHGFGLYQPNLRIRANGVSGALVIVSTTGTNQGPVNTQDNALQMGFDATKAFTVATELGSPFIGRVNPVTTTEEGGIFFGLDADNYVKLVLRRTDTGQASAILAAESSAVYQEGLGQTITPTLSLPFTGTIDLALVGDPISGTVTARYSIQPPPGGGAPTPWTTIGVVQATGFPALNGFFIAPSCSSGVTDCVATAGIQTTGPDVSYGFNFFEVLPSGTPAVVRHASHVYRPS